MRGAPLEIETQCPDHWNAALPILRLFFRKKRFMKRIFLFIVTNLAVLLLLGLVIFVIEQVFGVRWDKAARAACWFSRPSSGLAAR
jgi:hypothetical protein